MQRSNLRPTSPSCCPPSCIACGDFTGPVWNQLRQIEVLPKAVYDHNVSFTRRLRRAHAGKAFEAVHVVQVFDAALGQLNAARKKAMDHSQIQARVHECWLAAMIQTTVNTLEGGARLRFLNHGTSGPKAIIWSLTDAGSVHIARRRIAQL
jgi:hypothetical protein